MTNISVERLSTISCSQMRRQEEVCREEEKRHCDGALVDGIYKRSHDAIDL
jgi:hypothetical protein